MTYVRIYVGLSGHKKYHFAFRESKIISEFVFYSTIFEKLGCPQNVVHFQNR
jgi:hypothetical protein